MLLVKFKYTTELFLVLCAVGLFALIQVLYGVMTQPYFWDELGVYSGAANHLYQHGLSLLPSAMPDSLSRGHPLFCAFYFALAFKLFGNTPMVAHLAGAAFSIIGLIYLYKLLAIKWPKPYAFIGSLSLFVQPLFLSQTILVLPESLLLVCTLAALYHYLQAQNIACMVWLILALQIKESALVLPIAFMLANAIKHKHLWPKNSWYLGIIPIASFALFIGIQKLQNGYYFYPLHTELASFDGYFIAERWHDFLQFFLFDQGHSMQWLLSLLFISLPYVLKHKPFNLNLQANSISILIIIVGGLGFMVLNYFLTRYTQYFFILIYLIVFELAYATAIQNKWWLYLYPIALAIIGLWYWNPNQKYTDIDFTYSQHVKTVKACIDELKQTNYNDKTIGMEFPACASYWSSNNGYDIQFKHEMRLIGDSSKAKDYMVFTMPGNLADTAKYQGKIQCVKRFNQGYAAAYLYKVLP